MSTTFVLTIQFVDGQTQLQSRSDNMEDIRRFLERYDHEGSSISFTIHTEGEDAYKMIGRKDE